MEGGTGAGAGRFAAVTPFAPRSSMTLAPSASPSLPSVAPSSGALPFTTSFISGPLRPTGASSRALIDAIVSSAVTSSVTFFPRPVTVRRMADSARAPG